MTLRRSSARAINSQSTELHITCEIHLLLFVKFWNLLLQVLKGRKMEDWLRFSVCYWHSFCGTGTAVQLLWWPPRFSYRVCNSVFLRWRSFRVPDALPVLEWRSSHGSSQEAAESCVWVLHQTGSETNRLYYTEKIKYLIFTVHFN